MTAVINPASPKTWIPNSIGGVLASNKSVDPIKIAAIIIYIKGSVATYIIILHLFHIDIMKIYG